jgi:hypothetical protein
LRVPDPEPAAAPAARWGEEPDPATFGDDLAWGAPSAPVSLVVELPFWLMVENGRVGVEVAEHRFAVELRDDYYEWFVREMTESRHRRFLVGPLKDFSEFPVNIQASLRESLVPFFRRKCRTALAIDSTCNEAIFDQALAQRAAGQFNGSGTYYMRAFCEGHLAVVNRLIATYRWLTYDHFASTVTLWDLPVWWIVKGPSALNLIVYPYGGLDAKPILVDEQTGAERPLSLIDAAGLDAAGTPPMASGEPDLLDALNLVERGDYPGAVRRLADALEALLGRRSPADVVERMPDAEERWQEIRALRDAVTADEAPTSFTADRVERSIEAGRRLFNALEAKPDREAVREGRVVERSFGRHALTRVFTGEVTSEGVVVRRSPPPS